MSEKVVLKAMKCPTCGAALKAENDTEAIVCVYCGNTIIPVNDAALPLEQSAAFNGLLKVDGIQTASSALAYMELLFEEYDWDAFAYAQTRSIPEIDKLASSLKVTSADDKNTWFVCSKALSVPYMRKVEGCKQILAEVIEEYKQDDLDAYSKFDAYKRISTMLVAAKTTVVENLESFVANAVKYGATSAEAEVMRSDIREIVGVSLVDTYCNIEDIPAIAVFIEEKNAKILHELAAEGIDAEAEYARAKALMKNQDYAQALFVLSSLRGYFDTASLIKKINKYFLISDVLEIEGNLYYFKKEDANGETFNLYPTADGLVSKRPIIVDIRKIVAHYADIIYYLDGRCKLRQYNLSLGVEQKLGKETFSKNDIYSHNQRVYLLAKKSDYENLPDYKLVKLNPATGEVHVILEKVSQIVSVIGSKLLCKSYDEDCDGQYKININIIDTETLKITTLENNQLTIEGFVDNYVVYTQDSPNKYNKNLYIKALDSDEPEELIEQNIFSFCSIIANKLFYYVGNTRNQSLININCDCTERREWPLYISKVLFEQGGWLYFIKKAGYNSILCKSRLDGSKYSIIAADIEEFVEIKNGYLYYINYDSTLVRVRMDGSNLQELCEDVESVLTVKEDKIVFISIDGRIRGEEPTSDTKVVKSIYAVDFSGSGKIKLAYNVKNAKKYDENTVYYIAAEEIKSSHDKQDEKADVLYKLDVNTNRTSAQLSLEIEKESGLSAFAICMIFMVVTLFIGMIGFACESYGLGVFAWCGAFISLLVGVAKNKNKN